MKNLQKKTIFLTAVLTVLCAMTAFANGNTQQQRNALNQRKPSVTNQDLVIPIADLNEYINFYPVVIDGLQMEIMAVKAPDGSIRTAFNACHYCYQRSDDPKVLGYFMQTTGPLLVSLCGSERTYTMDKIQVSSDACHPEPITAANRTASSSSVIITREYLQQAKAMFADMKLLNEKGSCCD